MFAFSRGTPPPSPPSRWFTADGLANCAPPPLWKSISDRGFIDGIKSHIGLSGVGVEVEVGGGGCWLLSQGGRIRERDRWG